MICFRALKRKVEQRFYILCLYMFFMFLYFILFMCIYVYMYSYIHVYSYLHMNAYIQKVLFHII